MKILLVDDHPLLRGGMRFLLRGLDPDLVMDEAGDCPQALALVAGQGYDLILLDLNLPGLSGLDALAAVREAAPGVPLVVLSGESDPAIVRATIEAGAMGFIPKSSSPEVMIQALRLVFANGVYLPSLVLAVEQTAAPPAPSAQFGATALASLSSRQMEVLRGVINGKSNKVIARELRLTEGTVKAHLSSVYRVLGVQSRTEAVYAAAKLGLRLG